MILAIFGFPLFLKLTYGHPNPIGAAENLSSLNLTSISAKAGKLDAFSDLKLS